MKKMLVKIFCTAVTENDPNFLEKDNTSIFTESEKISNKQIKIQINGRILDSLKDHSSRTCQLIAKKESESNAQFCNYGSKGHPTSYRGWSNCPDTKDIRTDQLLYRRRRKG